MSELSCVARRLLLVGPGIGRITPAIQDRLASLLDLLPATARITVQTDAGSVTISSDGSSCRTATLDSPFGSIATAPGVNQR